MSLLLIGVWTLAVRAAALRYGAISRVLAWMGFLGGIAIVVVDRGNRGRHSYAPPAGHCRQAV